MSAPSRRVPLLPTLIVLAAVATMIALGMWQLQRLAWKETLLARYSQNLAMSSDVAWPRDAAAGERALYRHTTLECASARNFSSMAGRSLAGRSGVALTAECVLADGTLVPLTLGWSARPVLAQWAGGRVQGTIAPGPRLVAGPPLAGLEPNAAPDPRTIPNNHLAYAGQWFFFAATALAIYALALRRRG